MGIFTEEIERNLHQLSTFLQEDIKQVLIDDGHVGSGALVQSIKNTVETSISGMSIVGEMLIYGGAVIKGRRAGVKRIPVDALIEYLKAKNFSSDIKRTRGVAFHIQKRIFEEGIKPDDFLQKALDKNEFKIENSIIEASERALDLLFTNMINNANKSI